MHYYKVLEDSINREKSGIDYYYSDFDKQILCDMCQEINEKLGTSIQYLAEIDALNLRTSGNIMARYINKFSSESVKCFLIPQMVADRIENCDKIVLQLYLKFKESKEYISLPGQPAPAHIYVRYDNSFKKLKSKKIKYELFELMSCPRDAFYLPLTMKMLSSWHVEGLKELLLSYVDGSTLNANSFGLSEESQGEYFPTYFFIKKQLRLSSINNLKFYPTLDVYDFLKQYKTDPDIDICNLTTKVLRFIEKEL